MRKFLRLTATVAALLWFGVAHAQSRVIQGTVKDENGKSVPFMAVQVKGTTIGTYTDTAGKFTLAVDSTAKILVLSYPGLKDQQVAISDNMLITMKSDALGIDEVVVTAIGIPVEKKALGYATQTVTSDQLNNTGTGNVMDELDGKVAGLQVINSSGDPGSGTYMNLRGPTSLTGNNQPLIVVDGIPIDNSINDYDPTEGQGFLASGQGGAVNGGVQPTNRGLDINPSDIASVTVLKGPAATALYGIAAANGALIITTKKGSKNAEGLGIEFNSSLEYSTVNNLPPLQNEYAQGQDGVYAGPQTGTRYSWGPAISTLAYNGIPNDYNQYGNLVPAAPGLKPAQAYNQYNFFQTGVASDNNLSFSGGNDQSGFRLALGYLDQTGVVPLTGYNKGNINISGQSALSKRLKVSAGINYVNSVNEKAQQGNNTAGIMLGLLRTPPTFDNSNGVGKNAANNKSSYELLPSDSERDFRGGPGYDNPYWTVNENTFTSTINRVYGYTQADYDLTDWIKLTYRVGGDIYTQQDNLYYSPLSNTLGFPPGDIFLTDYINSLINSDFIVNFDRKLSDKFDLKVTLGQNYYTTIDNTHQAVGTGLVLDNLPSLANATGYNGTQEGQTTYRRSAFYGQAILGYADQLYLTVSGRDETTSTLSANNDNFFYPSVDLAWVFTQTLHMDKNKVLQYGKLRISYANVGQDAPPQSLTTPYRTAVTSDGFVNGVSFPYNGLPGYSLNNVEGNPNLLPQNTGSFEVGADLGFFENRISFSATYYNETTTNEILEVPLAPSSGYLAEELNAGEITNDGVELTLNTTPVKTKDFEWDLGVNWSRNVNKVVKLAVVGNDTVKSLLLDALGNIYDVPGYSTNQIYGTDFVRIPGTTYNPANPTANLVLDDQPGPNYGLPMASANAAAALAPTQPNWIGGITTSVRYKCFSVGAIMSIREGGYMVDGTQSALQYYGTAGVTSNRGQAYTAPAGSVWGHLNANGSVTVDPTALPETATYSEYYYQYASPYIDAITSSEIYPGGYVRISQLNFTWSLPSSWVHKAKFTHVSLTFFANNPVLWTKYPGVDPSTSFSGPGNGQGEDWFNNPGSKSYGVRLNVGL